MIKVLVCLLFQILSIICFMLSISEIYSADSAQSTFIVLGILSMIPGVGGSGCLYTLRGTALKVMDTTFFLTCSSSVILAIMAVVVGVAGGECFEKSVEQGYEIPLLTHRWND